MSQSSPDYARIPVKPNTRDELRAAKEGAESYDDVVRRLMNQANEASC